MATEVIMPVVDMTTEEMTILRWLKAEGETVKQGEPLLEVMTEKISMEIDAPADGIVRGIRFQAEAVVPTGEVVAYIVAEGEKLPTMDDATAAPVASASPAASVVSVSSADETDAVDAADGGVEATAGDAEDGARVVRAAPIVRRIAADLGVDLRLVRGTGPGGRVLADDVRAFVDRSPVASTALSPVASTSLSPVRQVIARRMQTSWQTAPHVTLTMDIDMSAAAAFRAQLREALVAEGSDTSLTWNSVIAWFTVQTLVRRPELNVTLEDGEIHSYDDVHLGVAVDTPRGLLVPVIPAAQRLRPARLADELARVAADAAAGTLQPADMAGATFTITNLGGFGIGAFTPILNPPQVGILGIGAVKDTIVPVEGAPAVRPVCTFSLSFDHRAVDGADGARFLAELREMMSQPHRLIV